MKNAKVIKKVDKYTCENIVVFSTLYKVTEPITVYKKVRYKTTPKVKQDAKIVPQPPRVRSRVISLTLPKGATFWKHNNSKKCRASRAISNGDGFSSYRPFVLDTMVRSPLKYTKGIVVKADKPKEFSKTASVCATGIHFYFEKDDADRHNF